MDNTKPVRVSEPSFTIRCPKCGTEIEPDNEAPREGITNPEKAIMHLRSLRARRTEALVVLTVDAQLNLIGKHIVSVGSLNTTSTHPREVLLPAVEDQAVGIMMAHNHPSGSLRWSDDDKTFTNRIREAAELMGFRLFDHLLVARGIRSYQSAKEGGWL